MYQHRQHEIARASSVVIAANIISAVVIIRGRRKIAKAVPKVNMAVYSTPEGGMGSGGGCRQAKIWRARSLLYRSRFSEVSTHLEALAEIYTIRTFAQISYIKMPINKLSIVCNIF